MSKDRRLGMTESPFEGSKRKKEVKKKKDLKFKEDVLKDLDEIGTKTKKIKTGVEITQAIAENNLSELEEQGKKIATTADTFTEIEDQAEDDEAVVHAATSCLGGCMHALIPRCFKLGKSQHEEKHDESLNKRKDKKAQAIRAPQSDEDDLFRDERPIVYQYVGKKATIHRFDEINRDLDDVDEGVERLKSIATDTASELQFQRQMVDSIENRSKKTDQHQKQSKRHIKKLALNG